MVRSLLGRRIPSRASQRIMGQAKHAPWRGQSIHRIHRCSSNIGVKRPPFNSVVPSTYLHPSSAPSTIQYGGGSSIRKEP